ncbi:dTDP-4-dehydrorhamnose 3,5-epimerase family protein [Corynebacterium bovis]|uniref:dTDP-4-dehydrorhamnose 3,5-epimerase n=1 Tax=Corynebacterium bovis DSM 20582 = CIP 54.80 TaxID=927655 RepID=A0A8H9Y7U0_9CORY|nr:dTDP-4-dehydrorhamnose 3,5-epimerase [Corynebacterium bovis]MBB3116627.1 dTDP-4-dehydrorhamnose 3,5-epimerase [Corynebacterium bovis DSM 20582 = CIP 54.80]QQC47183.1 dTDP-4-dehydrorhamnose 3,5-epimerase family protein [Corynebacterium bovis]RRO81430.1 dTDP-4-keto-6-deoxy-D-glucose epimerase [Corynebacterium bovis]RRO83269.1 dTDP-4-keto-6-deoxy-D-glucose epimerase [Corynebacterium bovis]RRO84797.1 dTDP-4-keto-6-deoxy-D-glucose epimerase [Corynebacterium bovis]
MTALDLPPLDPSAAAAPQDVRRTAGGEAVVDLPLHGAWVVTPAVHPDDRGTFHEWFRSDATTDVLGHPFQVAQANVSTSRRGVIRGIHVADVPPGQGKYVSCLAGTVHDVLVDLREGSPTFGDHVVVPLDAVSHRAVHVPVGVGHAFLAVTDATVAYLLTETYSPGTEHGVNPLDPEIGVAWDLAAAGVDAPVLSAKDRDAPLLADVRGDGGTASAPFTLPSYRECRGWEQELRREWAEIMEDE